MCTYMLRLGTAGFGGPVALVGYMHRDLVEQRKWISESEYREGLTLAQLMPGPLAAQLAIYLVSAVVTVITESESVWLFLGAGLITWAIRSRSQQAVSVTLPALSPVSAVLLLAAGKASFNELLLQITVFFTRAGAFVFGSGLAIVPFLYGGVVKEYGWLNDQQFLDAVAVAMVTPGPVVITVGFIGYLVTSPGAGFAAGLAGAAVAALATFLPCWLFTVLPAPWFRKHGRRPGITAFVDGVTAAAIGAIAGSCLVLGRRTVFIDGWQPEYPRVLVLAATLFLLTRFRRLSEPWVVAGAAILGLLLFPFLSR